MKRENTYLCWLRFDNIDVSKPARNEPELAISSATKNHGSVESETDSFVRALAIENGMLDT